MSEIHARHVVLGAGAMGAATAYHLARRGEPVVLVEQFALGHDRGSSHGAARITRHSYADLEYARLMPEAFRSWRELEADAGRPLYLRTGGVSVCDGSIDYVGRVAASLAEIGVPHRRMSGRQLRRELPVFGVADDADAVFEPDAGMLAAARIVRAEIELARKLGGPSTRVLENCQVRRVDLEGTHPVLETDAGTIVAERLVLAAGPWTARLVPGFPVPLRVTRQQVLYLRPPVGEAPSYGPGFFPVFIWMGREPLDAFYGMPTHDGLGVKVARHGGPDTDPDESDPVVSDEYQAEVRQFLRGFLPSLADRPVERTEVCLYTVAPDERFRVGPLAGRTDVFVASPCSGHGFKFSCLVGRVLADLAVSGKTEVPLDAWSCGDGPDGLC